MCHVEPFGNIYNGTPFETTINELHPENGDCLQPLTFCEILPVHVSRGCLLIGGTHTILRLTSPDQFDQLCQWMEYKQYLTIDDFYHSSYNDPENFDTEGPATEYKWKGKMNGHDPNPNHVNESLLSEVDWGAHNPDADDPEQLTGESIQSFLTFVVQLQWLVALGRLVTHAQVTTLSKLMVASS